MDWWRFLVTSALLYAVLLAGVALGFGVTVYEAVDARQAVKGASVELTQSTGLPLVDTINDVRSEYGVPAVRVDAELTTVAGLRTSDMIGNRYYAHAFSGDKDYSDLLSAPREFSCENLDMNMSTQSEDIISDWLNSKDHRACLLHPQVRKIGASEPQHFANGHYLTTIILATSK